MDSGTLARLPFLSAANIWLDTRTSIEESTRNNYRSYFIPLNLFFGRLVLSEIEIGHIATYQSQRQRGEIPGLRKAGASCVNHELNTLKQILERAGLWAALADWYEPLPQPASRVGCALTEAQERRLFEVASSRKRWFVAYCCSILTVNTTAGPGEIRKLQLQDIDVLRRTLRVREGAKNAHRVRTIPLNDDALWAMRELMARAAKLGAIYPHHYLLPHRAADQGQKPDPTKPMGGWRKAWEALRVAAGMPKLRRYDLRHHAITKLLENPNVPERAVIDLAGHVSNAMLETYSHTRQDALRAAVEAVSTNVARPRAVNVVEFKAPPAVKPHSEETPCPIPITSTLSLHGNWQLRPSAIYADSPVSTSFSGKERRQK